MMSDIKNLARDRRGLAAIEFALLAPLLCLVLAVSVEVGRMLIMQQAFETAVTGVSRHLARYPEYEIRARNYSRPILRQLLPAADADLVNLVVASLVKSDGALKEVFPAHALIGSDPTIKWRDFVRPQDFFDEENIIFVGATFPYRPVFTILPNLNIVFRKNIVIHPSFSMKYPWNDRQVDDSDYVY